MANTIKQLASFAVLNVNGGDRVTYTYDEIDADTGELISANNRGNFFAVDPAFKSKITQVRNYISENKLGE
jgi:hypothetical protein